MAAPDILAMEHSIDLPTSVFRYFSRTNYANKSILLQEKTLKKHMKEQWENIPSQRQDDLLDLLSVNEEVRKKYNIDYGNGPTNKVVDESFPRLMINMGQKINVDFENELWTWKDEHSGPFSWMSRSQQDLTLADLEEDNILKPQPKQLRVDLEEEGSQKKAEPQFTYPCSSWCLDTLTDFYRRQDAVVLTPSPSLDLVSEAVKAGSSAEELNPAFEDSVDDDLSPRSSPEKDNSRESSPEQEENPQKSKKKDRGRKSPSPKKMVIHSNSFKKSPVKKSERGKDEKLIEKGEEHSVSEVYCNPAMESEWSSFVGEQKANQYVTDAPVMQVMDRGTSEACCASSAASPYRGDQVRLISEAEESPAVGRSEQTPDSSEWSVESTPDHRTHLLKGLQSPEHHKTLVSRLPLDNDGDRDHSMGDVPSDQTEEMLSVVLEGSHIQVTCEETQKRISNIPSTGFDFLDNW